MSVQVPRARVVLGLLIVLVLFTGSLPSATALHGSAEPSVTLCGAVQNAAGWPLEGVNVRVLGRGMTNSDHFPGPVTTDGDGRFEIKILTDFYRVVIEDGFVSQDRAGATYQPHVGEVAGHTLRPGDCGLAKGGIEYPSVTLVAPGVNFVEVSVRDAVDDMPLANATVSTKVLGFHTWGRATTDASGTAYLTCPLHVPATIETALTAYDPTAQDVSCTSLQMGEEVRIWRSAVQVNGTLTDDTTDETVADVDVTATPAVPLPADHPYMLSGASEADGTYALGLPWGETFDVLFEKGAYASYRESDVIPTVDDLGTSISIDLVLARADKVFSGTLTEVNGTTVEGNLTFIGPFPTTETVIAPTANGAFSLTLPVGTYDIAIDAPGKNPRGCALTLVYEDDDVFDDTCLILVTEGKGAVQGTILDGLTEKPLPGVTVGSALTDDAGTFRLELPPGQHTLGVSHAGFNTTEVDVDVTLDAIVHAGTTKLLRDSVGFTVNVADASGASIAGANVCPTFIPVDDDAPVAHPCRLSDEDGIVTFPLQWTSLDGGYDIGDYAFTVERFTAAPFYANTICIDEVDVPYQAAGFDKPCAATVVPALTTSVGPLLDAHTLTPVAGVAVSTVLPDDVPCLAPYVCTAETVVEGDAVLLLPEGFTFTVSAEHAAYRERTSEDVLAGTGALVDAELFRLSHPVNVTLSDAHTGATVASAAIDASAIGFSCSPDGAYLCTATTDESGVATLEVPWGDYDFILADGEYDVVVDADFDDVEEDVRFTGTTWTTQSVGPGLDLEGALVRQLGAPLVVDVKSFDGTLVPAASLTVQSERFGDFDCAPGASVDPCDVAHDASSGVVALQLPHGTSADHTWWVTVNAPGHFSEEATGLSTTLDVVNEIMLWPTQFDLVVDPRDLATGETVPLVVVCVTNVDDTGASATTPPPREVCKSSGVEPEALVFTDTTWRRTATDDQTDRFLVRAVGTLHFPSMVVRDAGPAATGVTIPMVPTNPQTPEAQTGLVTGRVVDADASSEGSGVVGARVLATSDGCAVSGYEGASGLDGAFVVPVACHGTFRVDVVDPRYEATGLQEVEVPDAEPLDFTLERMHRNATVTVLDANGGAPVIGASVRFTGLDTSASLPSVTDATGRAMVSLPWGTYSVLVQAPDGDWLVENAQSALVVSHLADGETTVVLTSVPAAPATCAADDGSPDLCDSGESDTSVELIGVAAMGRTKAVSGNWVLVPPQAGAAAILGVGESADARTYAGPHDGTWTIVYVPSLAGIGGMPEFPITLTLTYMSGGEERSLEAILTDAIVGPTPFVSPVLSWQVNLHSDESLTCLGPRTACEAHGGISLDAAGRARFFAP